MFGVYVFGDTSGLCVAFPVFNFSARAEGYDNRCVWRIKGEVT